MNTKREQPIVLLIRVACVLFGKIRNLYALLIIIHFTSISACVYYTTNIHSIDSEVTVYVCRTIKMASAISCPKPIHLPPTHFAFLEEGVFLAKMIKSVQLRTVLIFHFTYTLFYVSLITFVPCYVPSCC